MAAALTRLTMTQRLGRWSGQIDPSEITTTIGSLELQVGNFVAFIDQAWLDIQMSQGNRWQWMRSRSINTVSLTTSVRTLAASAIASTCRTILPFLARDVKPLRYVLLKHPTTDAIGMCEYVPYSFWRGYFDRGDRPEGRPAKFTIRPDGTAEFDPTPDVAYKIDCDYVIVPTELTADASSPAMPAHFHMLVVWWAMVHLMDLDEKGGRYQTAERQYKQMLNRLKIEQLAEDLHDEFLSTGEIYSG